MFARALKSSRASKYDILRELPECDHLTDERHDLRQETVGPYVLCLDHERSSLIDRCTHHTITDALLNGQRFAREHRLIDTRLTAHDPTIDRNLFPGSDSNPIPDRQG